MPGPLQFQRLIMNILCLQYHDLPFRNSLLLVLLDAIFLFSRALRSSAQFLNSGFHRI
jgi:hypothetical protein